MGNCLPKEKELTFGWKPESYMQRKKLISDILESYIVIPDLVNIVHLYVPYPWFMREVNDYNQYKEGCTDKIYQIDSAKFG